VTNLSNVHEAGGKGVPGCRCGQSRRAQDRRAHRHGCEHSCGRDCGQRPSPRMGRRREDRTGTARVHGGRSRRQVSGGCGNGFGKSEQLIYCEAQRRGVLCNVVDVPEYCDFYYPAVVRRGDLQIAISTAGQSPALAQKIRQQLERQFGAGYAAWVKQLGETRQLILASGLDQETKWELLHSLASREAFEAALAKIQEMSARS